MLKIDDDHDEKLCVNPVYKVYLFQISYKSIKPFERERERLM